MRLKDGLLGAAVGWHLTRKGIVFWHALCEKGTEIDFIAQARNGQLLIECKILSILNAKQLARNIRESLKQLDDHAALLQNEGWELQGSICVVNLTDSDLTFLRRSGFPIGGSPNRVVSYEQFPRWLHEQGKDGS